MEKTITAADANRKFSELLRGVREGRTFLVTSHGRPVAKVIPAEEDSRSADAGRAALFSRLEKQKPARGAAARRRWTREGLYED
jgi:prevent-host-death family protein